jgi:tripartite-type tricarboxylate transporter receptor subunit TctC
VVKDFAGVALVGEAPLVFVSSGKSGVKSIAALRAMVARNEPLSFASPSAETQLATALIAEGLNVRPLIVPYKGAGPAMTDVVGGHVPFMVSSIASVQPFRDTGRLNLLGVASNKRFSGWPDVPTLAEQGLQVEAKAWYILLAPAGTPPPILQRVNSLIESASRTGAYQAGLKSLSIEPMHATALESDAFLRSEAARWRDMMKAAGIEPE